MPDSAPQHPVIVVPSASRSAGVADSGVLPGWGGRKNVSAKLIVTAVTGNVVITVEHSDTGTGGWTAADTFPAQSGTTTGVERVVQTTPLKPFLRIGWNVTTGPVTFSVTLAQTSALMGVG